MDFTLSNEHLDIANRTAAAADRLVESDIEAYREQRFNIEMQKVFADAGITGLQIPEEFGGMGVDSLGQTVAMQELGRRSLSMRTFMSVHGMCAFGINQWGNDEQRERYLPALASGEVIGAFALTESLHGSDPASLETTYAKDGDDYVLNGGKTWISSATVADLIITFARGQDGEVAGFILESGMDGCETSLLENKMGLRSEDTGKIHFNDCRIPEENMMGESGDGLKIALSIIMLGRLGVSGSGVGTIQACLEEAASYAREREQFGEPIGKKQLVQRYLAEMAINADAAQWMTYAAAIKRDRHLEDMDDKRALAAADNATSKAKHFATEKSFEAAHNAVQILGSRGYSLDRRCARHMVDSRATTIYEGTNEIHELKIAQHILGKEFSAFR